MVVIRCSVPGCNYTTENVSEALAIALLTNHGLAHQVAPRDNAHRGPKLDRPKVDIGVTIEEWNIFLRRWTWFKDGSHIDNASAPSQLFQCAGPDLGDRLLTSDANIASKTVEQILAAMRSLAVVPVAASVLRSELLQLHQDRDESCRAFAARVRGKAEACAFVAQCQHRCQCGEVCTGNVDYTDNVIRDILLNGIYDLDIRRDVLGTRDIIKTPVNDVVALVEGKEMARNALPSSAQSAVSTFRRQQKATKVQPTLVMPTPSQADRSKHGQCPDCQKSYQLFTQGAKGWNSKPHALCIDCWRARRRRKRPLEVRQQPPSELQVVESDLVSQLTANHCFAVEPQSERQAHRLLAIAQHGDINIVSLDHHVFSKGEWKRARLRDHPKVHITISLDKSAWWHKKKGDGPATASPIDATITAVADSGAQSDLWSLDEYLAHGFSRSDLAPVKMTFTAANRSPIPIEGAFFATIGTQSASGVRKTCRSMIYVSSAVRTMYLSYESMLNLGIINLAFLDVSELNKPPRNSPLGTPHINVVRDVNDGCNAPRHENNPCSCPQRTMTPLRPSVLPFECTPANNAIMKDWLLKRYAASTFNTCPHRPLPCMEGPPIEIHIDPDATPKTCHTPANIPIHWHQQVYEDLLRDEALGVIERVPYGEPVTWCHRMVVTRKHDGSPRRTVDLSPLNKYCMRETFATESPFHLARRVPRDTWKTVTDAWNGFHSVPLRDSDRHLTTFITPFGLWRYTRAPQGFLSSGDGYNRRFDAVLMEFERKERCVDDTVHYDSNLEDHWWRTIDFLTRVGQAGIVLNPDKFQFAQQTVDFAGFRISSSSIEPLPKYIDAIRDFPTPTSTTDVRSWFGLVNQVANYNQLRELMAPFKPFLSPRHKFAWCQELEEAFQASKTMIIAAIREGVEIFDVHKRTCLRPDWSCKGIGYFLLQQHCDCRSNSPDCCPNGWRITLAGSRFLSSAEQRYAAIEGEALAVAWGLEQTRYFTHGCDDLVVVTDHKPLVKLFGDRTLDEITNCRLFRLKQRTLPWRFTIQHSPGKSNHAADATSRHPSPSSNIDCLSAPDILESTFMAAIERDAHSMTTLSWSRLAQETAADTSMAHLVLLIERGITEEDKNDPSIAPFWPIRDFLYTEDGVILYKDRVVVPPSLQNKVLQYLHAAHQGTSSMEQRARGIVYWPGMSKDIQDTRNSCSDCNRNAPSQAATPPVISTPPATPFEAVFADFFEYSGRHYLAVGDRLSGWVEVFSSTPSSDVAGAAGLIRHLRTLFSTFGVPEELSSDGGPEFTASLTKDFLRRWGVHHRISSAYFPQSNGRAEVAVKAAKRLLMSNTGPTGQLDHDRFLCAMLQLRNTPDPDCDVSPAQIIFGHPLRDAFSFTNRLEKFKNPHIRPLWTQAWATKEQALRVRMTHTLEKLGAHSRTLQRLAIGDRVFIQNQHGRHPTKWDRSGTVMEALDHDQYWVKVDGSGRLTLRNRRFLRAFTPATPAFKLRATPTPGSSIPETPSTIPPQFGLTVPTGVLPPSTERNLVQAESPPSDVDQVNPPADSSETSPSRPSMLEDAPAPASLMKEPHPSSLAKERPRRAPHPRMFFEPESGHWVNR